MAAAPFHSPVPSADTLLPATASGVLRAAELIAQGNLVIVPTETVYGIVLNLRSTGARKKARDVKTCAHEANAGPASAPHPPLRSGPWVIHVAHPDDIFWGCRMSRRWPAGSSPYLSPARSPLRSGSTRPPPPPPWIASAKPPTKPSTTPKILRER